MTVLIYNSHARSATTETVNSLKQLTVAEILTTNPFVHNLATVETLTGRLSHKSERNLITTEALITKSLNQRLKFLDNQLTTVEAKNIETTTTKSGDIETPIENSSNSETTIDVALTVKNNEQTSVKTGGVLSVKTDAPTSVKTDGPTPVKTDTPTSVKNNDPTSVKTDAPTPVKRGGPTTVKAGGLTSVKTLGPTSTKTDAPTSVKTDAPTSTKTDAPTSLKNNEPTSTKTDTPTSVKIGVPTTVKTGGLTSVKTLGPTSTKTDAPTSVKTDAPTSVKTGGLTSVKTLGPTSIKTDAPTSLKYNEPTSTKTDAPTSVKTGGLTSVKTLGPTSTKTDAPTSVKTDAPTSTKTDAPTSVKTDAPTSIKTDAPTSLKYNEPTSTKTDAPTSVKTDAPTSTKTDAPTSVKTDAPTSIKTDAPTSLKYNEPTSTKTDAPTSVKTGGLTSVKTLGPTATKTDAPTSVKTGGLTSVKTLGPTSTKTDAPTSVKTDAPTSVKTGGLTSVKTLGPTSIKTDAPTSLKYNEPTSTKTDAPTSVKTGGITSVKTPGPTSIKTDAPTSLKYNEPTSIKTDALTSVKTGGQTSVKTDAPTSVKTVGPTSTKRDGSISVSHEISGSASLNLLKDKTTTRNDMNVTSQAVNIGNSKSSTKQVEMESTTNLFQKETTDLLVTDTTEAIFSIDETKESYLSVYTTTDNKQDRTTSTHFNRQTPLKLITAEKREAKASTEGPVTVPHGEKRVPSITTQSGYLQSSKATQSTVGLTSSALSASMSTSTGKINDKTIKANYSENDNTTITTFSTRPTGPSSTKRVVSITECEQDIASIDNNRVYTFLCTGLQTGNTVRWYEVHNDLSNVVATCLTAPDPCLNPDPCFNATRNGTVSELRVATTFWENTDGKMECRETINSVETQANLTVTLIPPKDTSGHHGGSKTTGWSPNGTTFTSRVITTTAYVSHHTQDMTTVSSTSLSDQHNGEETTFTSKNSRADVSSVTTPVMGETSERTQSISLSHTPSADRQTTVETTRKEITQDLYTTSIVPGERTTMKYRETTPSSTVSVMNRNTTTSNTLGLEATSSTTRNSETTENDQRSVETTEIKTENGKSTTYATNNSKTTWKSETTEMSRPNDEKTDMYTEYGKLTTYTTSNSKTTDSEWKSESTEMRMPSDETTNTNRWSEDVTTEHTATWDNEKANSEITSSLHRQSSNTSPQTSIFVMSSSVETNSEMTSAPPTGVITETKSLTSEYVKTTETSVTNNLTTAADVPRGQRTPTSLFQGETTFSDHFNRESTEHNAGKGGTTNTMSENVDTTTIESMFDNTTNNMTSVNEGIESTAQTSFTKEVSEHGLTASKTVSPSASIGDKSTEYFSTLETSSSRNYRALLSPTSMASAQKKDDQSSGDVLVAAVAGTFSVLAAVCLAAAIFFACYKSQKLTNRIIPEITKRRDGKGGVENGLMQEMINIASRQGRGLNEPNTKNTTDFTVFMAETSLSRETRKPASTSVSTGKGFNDKISAYSFVDERAPHSRNNEHRNIKWKEAVKNVVDESSGKGRPAPKLTLKELAELHREKRLVNSTPKVDISSEMTDANRAKNLRDIYAIVDRSKKRDSLETRKNESDEESQALSNPNLDEATNSHLPASIGG
ncbi:hypothetical protein C0Q70_12852 [Pomacea canaliculata]|uniref:Uncharacterized protein n=1 Tax=Pomacea canaliculata TaxID=400727 RepID=A0A2T7P2P4_POMCA|nr:hypothetical protein C0Q70_12852 [Pomacea canaliculata]